MTVRPGGQSGEFVGIRGSKYIAAILITIMITTAGCGSIASGGTTTDGDTDTNDDSGTVVSTAGSSQDKISYVDIAVRHPKTAKVGQEMTLRFEITAQQALSSLKIEFDPPAAFGDATVERSFEALDSGEQVEWKITVQASSQTDELMMIRTTGSPSGEEFQFERKMAIKVLVGQSDTSGDGGGGGSTPVGTGSGNE